MLTRLFSCVIVHALIVICLISVIPMDAAGQTHLWSQRFGGTDYDWGRGVSVDGSGSVFTIGDFAGTVDFGGGPRISAGGRDIYLAKYDASGTHLWSHRFGSTGHDYGQSVAVDASGNVIIAGYFNGAVDFGDGPLTSAGSTDIFLAKYDATGAHVWSQRFGGTSQDAGWSVSVDTSGSVLLTGFFSGGVDFGGGQLSSAGGSWDVFLAKFDASGTHLSSQGFGGTEDDFGHGVSVDVSGNVVVVGHFLGTVDFGTGSITSAGTLDIFLAKYDASGTPLWSRGFGSSDYDIGNSVVVDGSGSVFVTGYFNNTVDFGGGPLIATASDVFLAKYDASGTHLWSQRFGDTSSDAGMDVSVDGSGNVFLAGTFANTVDFGGGGLTSAGAFDVFLAKYDASGAHVWSQRFGGAGYDYGNSAAVDGSGHIAVTGAFNETANFGGGDLTSAGQRDIYLASYTDPAVAVAISSFDARALEGGVVLRASFTSSLQVLGINVYRGEESGGLLLHENVPHTGSTFHYEDHHTAPGRTYRYQIGVVDDDGEFFSQIVTARTQTLVTALLPNTPNPFNPSTTIRFTLARAEQVTLSVYDVRGVRVITLVDGFYTAGPHDIQWDGTDATGSQVSSGVYFYRMRAGHRVLTRRMVLLK